MERLRNGQGKVIDRWQKGHGKVLFELCKNQQKVEQEYEETGLSELVILKFGNNNLGQKITKCEDSLYSQKLQKQF